VPFLQNGLVRAIELSRARAMDEKYITWVNHAMCKLRASGGLVSDQPPLTTDEQAVWGEARSEKTVRPHLSRGKDTA